MKSLASCHAHWNAGVLTIGNKLFGETWHLGDGGQLRLSSFLHKEGGIDWVAPSKAPVLESAPWSASFQVKHGRKHASETESLLVELRLEGPNADAWRLFQFQVFPQVAGSIMQVSSSKKQALTALSAEGHVSADGIETGAPQEKGKSAEENGELVSFSLRSSHLAVRDVQFTDQTDHHANFTAVREWMTHPSERPISLQSNLVQIEDPALEGTNGNCGFCWLLLAPLRHVRHGWSAPADFVIGFRDGALAASVFPQDYPLARIAYAGGQAGATVALHALQQALHAWISGRDGILLSNTWGDRGRADRIGEAFMLEEIAAAKELGVEVVQLDDGWQKGSTANTAAQRDQGVWNGFWAADPAFWNPHPERFPRGLEPVVKAAREAGLRIGLWYAPDSSDNMRNWERDAAQILHLWRTHGVEHFKLDAVKLHSRESEMRMGAFCERVQQESGGRILFDFDATAEHRTTYWGRVPGGTLFLENRYTDWGNYYPHQTLRAVWSLSSWVLPSRLRMEFLNPSRNHERYADDPLRPSAYPADYLFAVTMVASPLAWFENSRIPADVLKTWSLLITVWKKHRDAFHLGQVWPVGGAPDGYSWTGFVAWKQDGEKTDCGWLYALIFRELASSNEESMTLPVPSAKYVTDTACELLAGQGSASIVSNNAVKIELQVSIPEKQRFLLGRWKLSGLGK